MKTMKKGSEVRRVSEKQVDQKLAQGWNYCPKSEWKGSGKISDEIEIKKVDEEIITKVNPYKRKN